MRAIKQVFVAFQVKHGADLGKTGHAHLCRAIYGVDVMITADFQPKILECTFSPDCKRACKFNPDFFNNVFGTLFFNESNNVS
jgi:tubulin--tyrosine ligase-like protein 12